MIGKMRWLAMLVLLPLLAGCSLGEEEPTLSPADEGTPAEEPVPEIEAVVLDLVNDVDAHPLPADEWEDAREEMVIYAGGEVWAQEASTARVGIEADVVRVAPNTIFTLEQPEAGTLQLTLDEGQVWVNVEGLEEGETFQVETPGAVASVRGTRFSVRVEEDGTTVVSTWVSTVTVSAAGAEVAVGAGYQTRVEMGDPPGAPLPMVPTVEATWGMASGDRLDVALPVIGASTLVTNSGYLQEWGCSSSGEVLFAEFYHPENGSPAATEFLFYDLSASESYSASLPADTYEVALNPSADQLAYSTRDTDQICTSDIDGANPSCFDQSTGYPGLTWSPDGAWLLFYPPIISYGGEAPISSYNLYRVRPDGSDVTQLTFFEQGQAQNPAWSPDSSQIAYVYIEDYESPGDLWVMDADGSDPALLMEDVPWFDPPAWSPDGTQLAVPGATDEETGEGQGLWLVPLDGTAPQQVPGTEGSACGAPVWSPAPSGWPLFFKAYRPASSSSFYSSEDGKLFGVWWYAPDGGRAATHLNWADYGPLWCVDGAQQAVFGFLQRKSYEDAHWWMEVHVFSLEPSLWAFD